MEKQYVMVVYVRSKLQQVVAVEQLKKWGDELRGPDGIMINDIHIDEVWEPAETAGRK
jgi:hypothetical protein